MPRLIGVESCSFGQQWDLSFALDGELEGRFVRALVHRPIRFERDAPVIAVMHGVTRAADQYMCSWMTIAERLGFLLIVPEFSRRSWPRSSMYNLGNMRRADGSMLPRSAWTFTVLDQVVEAAKRQAGSTATSFGLYGHSAGAQFVHRYLLMTGGDNISAAVAANAGWYTLPTSESAFPYGIADLPSAMALRRWALGKRLTILLGSEDTNAMDPDLRRTAQAMAQGEHRLARGRYFMHVATEVAKSLDAQCNWDCLEVPGAGHNDRDLSALAASIILRSESAVRLDRRNMFG